MILPDTLIMRSLGSGDGVRGYAFERTRDDEGYGVELACTRQRWGAPWKQEWSYDWLPDQVFPTYNLLREAVQRLNEAEIATEKAKYPRIRTWHALNGSGLANACAVCKRDNPEATTNNGTVAIYIARNWRPRGDTYVELCTKHRYLLDDRIELSRLVLGGQ